MLIELRNMNKSYGIDRILTDISLKVEEKERVGLIGANGAGKSTILKIISQEIPCDSGDIFIKKDCRIGFLRQNGPLNQENTIWDEMMSVFSDITALEKEMRSLEKQMAVVTDEAEHQKLLKSYAVKSELFEKNDGFVLRSKIMTVLNGMGFEGFALDSVIQNLSGGEKTKLSMAKILLEEPELLMLDEPTNHLDFKVLGWLEGYLKKYNGAVLVVSHDRYFLNSVVQVIYEVERTEIKRYAGNYSAFLEQKAQARASAEKSYEAQQKEIKKLEDYVSRNLARASTSKMAKSRRKTLDKMDVMERPDGDLKSCRFWFQCHRSSHKDVLTVEQMDVLIDRNTPLLHQIGFEIKKGERVALIGDNGVGKSTLFKTLAGRRREYAGNFAWGGNVDISYYDQEQAEINSAKTLLDEIWDRHPGMEEVKIRTLLGTLLFTDEDVFKRVCDLSGGERAKLAMLEIMLQNGNVLMLDEPTNHLDLSSKEALEDALLDYEGTVFFISHDRYFINRAANRVLELQPSCIRSFDGNYDYYLEKRGEPLAGGEASVKEKRPNSYEENKRKQAELRSKQKKLENTEGKIAELEQQLGDLEQEVGTLGSDYLALQEKYQQIEQKNQELEQCYELWNTLTEELSQDEPV